VPSEQTRSECDASRRLDLVDVPPAVAEDDFALNCLHLAAVDGEWFSPSQEKALPLPVTSSAKVEFVLTNPDTWPELRRRVANLLTELPQRGVLMRLAWSETSTRRDPERLVDAGPLYLLKQHPAKGIEQHDAGGVSRDYSTVHRLPIVSFSWMTGSSV
jgi:hypothetical protein